MDRAIALGFFDGLHLGHQALLEQAARLADTIPYELLCAISPRIPRLYLENGQQVSV